ncbi:PstS family phosphate ABC transporter substrate-binding protein [Yoonia sp.]|uniref:PstS family phosphate ABC transporter substrate-binding protein n=1 Tax=Yoonia sp. TaxID=2212373 RepID=UPI003F6BB939
MSNKFAASLFLAVTPVVAFAEPVELRSTDGFISVEGEVVGFNGSMAFVETSVGRVSVPVSEVGCYGAGCTSLLANNDFGLSAADLQGVFAGGEAIEAVVAADATTQALSVSLADAKIAGLFETLSTVFADGGEAAPVSIVEDAEAGDINITTTPLTGSADLQYPSPADWAMTTQPTHQMLGLDAFAVIAPGNVGVNAVSVAQLAAIYAGEITNWSELGGTNTAILPLQLPKGAPSRMELNRIVMAPQGKTIADSVLIMADEQGIAASVNQFPGSISVVGLDSIGDTQTLAVSGSCGQPVTPTAFNIISGDYPLLRPVMANYSQAVNAPQVRALFDFATSPDVQDLFAASGYLNQTATIQNGVDKNARLNTLLTANLNDAERMAAAQMFQDMFPADRLSPTFYGGPASGPEGAWNRAMFRSLESLLNEPEFTDREIIFVGYATSTNGTDAAINISREAAAAVQAAFNQYAPETISTNRLRFSARGFGTVAPVTCYSGQVSINAYSRVEVWVR